MESETAAVTKYDQKLRRILRAAAAVFAEEGYDRASIRTVADRAEVSVAGLYYYVRSKEELLFHIQHHAFDSLVEDFKRDSCNVDDPEDRLELFVKNHVSRFVGNMPELVVCSRENDRLQGDLKENIEKKQREYYRQARAIFVALAKKYGGDAERIDPRTATLAMFGSINWIYTWYRPESRKSASRLAEDFVQMFLSGFVGNGKTRPRAARKPRARDA